LPWVQSGSTGAVNLRGEFGTGRSQACHGYAVRASIRVARQPVSAAAQQADRASGVSAQHVRETDGYLRQAPPQLPLGWRRGLPDRLEYLVRVERAIGVNQFLGGG
jgi:hypothetical protein